VDRKTATSTSTDYPASHLAVLTNPGANLGTNQTSNLGTTPFSPEISVPYDVTPLDLGRGKQHDPLMELYGDYMEYYGSAMGFYVFA
jgi:hypothetical protein